MSITPIKASDLPCHNEMTRNLCMSFPLIDWSCSDSLCWLPCMWWSSAEISASLWVLKFICGGYLRLKPCEAHLYCLIVHCRRCLSSVWSRTVVMLDSHPVHLLVYALLRMVFGKPSLAAEQCVFPLLSVPAPRSFPRQLSINRPYQADVSPLYRTLRIYTSETRHSRHLVSDTTPDLSPLRHAADGWMMMCISNYFYVASMPIWYWGIIIIWNFIDNCFVLCYWHSLGILMEDLTIVQSSWRLQRPLIV
jgi:hypothetical protein